MTSAYSAMSAFSFASAGSAGSTLSIGSIGSVLSVGSSGSILSIGSSGSIGGRRVIGAEQSGRVLAMLALAAAWRER